ncbi:hypothetical protein IWW51_000584 [Coemansia sp. RSA 2702]|nr:hypothetical protein IWW51_000584 [Coemansia sp. RSA 2702]
MSTATRLDHSILPTYFDARNGGYGMNGGEASNASTDEHRVARQLQQLVLDPPERYVGQQGPEATDSPTPTQVNTPGGTAAATWDFLSNAAQMFGRPAEISEVTQADMARGIDVQGYRWSGCEPQRRMYMEYRREVYPQYQGVPHDVQKVRKQARCVDNTHEYFRLRYSVTGDKSRCKVSHFQLRDLVWATSSYDVFYWHADGVQQWDPWRRRHTSVLARSALPDAFRLSALCVDAGVVFAGDYQGRICAKSLWGEGSVAEARLGADMVTHATPTGRGISVARNSGRVDLVNVERMEATESALFEWPVNCTAEAASGAFGCVVGDSLQALVVDPRQGLAAVAPLQGHLDHAFTCAISPDERLVATGSQDSSVRVYDVRWPRVPVAVLCGYLGAMRHVRFSSCGGFLLAAEPADYVHVYETGLFERAQDVEFMGEVAGAAFSPDANCLFVAISDAVHENALAEYTRIVPADDSTYWL